MRLGFALTLACALALVLVAGTADAQSSVADPTIGSSGITIGHPRAAVLTLHHSAAESFLLVEPGTRDEPLQPAIRTGILRLAADYEALFMPLTAGWARYKLEAWRISGGDRELLDEDMAAVVDFGPARHAGRLGLELRLQPGIHQIHLVATTQARAVGVSDWTSDIDAVTVWVLVPDTNAMSLTSVAAASSPSVPRLEQASSSATTGEDASDATDAAEPVGRVPAGLSGLDPERDSSLPVGGLAVGSQRAVAATTAVGALNFPTGHNRTLVVGEGEPVVVWSDYELWWTELAQAEAGAALIISHRPTANDAGSAEVARADFVVDEATGPRLDDGMLRVSFKFENAGIYRLAATLHIGVRSAGGRSIDEDVVDFTVRVVSSQPPVGAIAGRVVADDGSALEGVRLEATDSTGRVVGVGRTNADGHYLIEKLPVAKYLVHAVPEDVNFLDEWWKDSPSMHGAEPVAVRANTITEGIDFSLAAGGTIAGQVTDLTGHPLGEIEISVGHLRSADDSRDPSDPAPAQATIARTKTNDEGYYSIDRLRPNAYWVRARDPVGSYRTEFFDDQPDFAHADKVWVKSGETTDGIDFELAAGGAIVGTVAAASSSGLMTPLPGILVEARSVADPAHVIASALTNRQGRYRIGGLLAGAYLVRASDRTGKYLPEWFKEASSPEEAERVPVEAGETTDGVCFTLEPAPLDAAVFISPARMGVTLGGGGKLHVAVAGVENLGAFETVVA